MDCIEDVFEDQGHINHCVKLQHVLVCINGHERAWVKQEKPPKIESSAPANKSDESWEIGGYDSWNIYREVNLPQFDSQCVNGADQWMTGPRVNASASKLIKPSQ
jgi:hypothetical protein